MDVLEVEIQDEVRWDIRVSVTDIFVRDNDKGTVFVLGFDSGVAIFNDNPCTLDYLNKVARDIELLIDSGSDVVTGLYFSKDHTRVQAELGDWPFASQILRLAATALTDYSQQVVELHTHDVQSVDRDVIKRDRLCASMTLLMSCFRPTLTDRDELPVPQLLEFARAAHDDWIEESSLDDEALPQMADTPPTIVRLEEELPPVLEGPVVQEITEDAFGEFNPILDMLSVPKASRQGEMAWIDEHGRQKYIDSEPTKVLSTLCFEKKRHKPPTVVDWPDLVG